MTDTVKQATPVIDWTGGDTLGLELPAHSAALREGGATFLTEAFQATGALSATNSVATITHFEQCPGGSTGRKLLLSVRYAHPAPDLHEDLFVKFSRDFDDPLRDGARIQMEREVQFALLSRVPGFPIAVPNCYFADFHRASGTGIMISQRVAFGSEGIEPHYEKCLDYRMPELLQHYKALVRSLARLAGTHKAGRLPPSVERDFPFDASQLAVSRRAPYTPQQIRNRVARYADFAAAYPRLLPDNIRSPEFLARLADEAPRFMSLVPRAMDKLASEQNLIALCHWNANIDNAWFRRNPSGELECGLMDWGNVSQMNVAMALWGCLSAAETELWDRHLQELLDLFVLEYTSCGGLEVSTGNLKLHLLLYAAAMGLAWLLDAPALLTRLVPDLAEVESRFDARIAGNEAARAQLQFMTVFLNLWETQDMADVLRQLSTCGGQVGRTPHSPDGSDILVL
jgi:hypothetical protein